MPPGETVPATVTVPATPANTAVPEGTSMPVAVPATVVANVAAEADHVPEPPMPCDAVGAHQLPVTIGPVEADIDRLSMPSAWPKELPARPA